MELLFLYILIKLVTNSISPTNFGAARKINSKMKIRIKNLKFGSVGSIGN